MMQTITMGEMNVATVVTDVAATMAAMAIEAVGSATNQLPQ